MKGIDTEATSFFAVQMLLQVVKNMVAAGVYDVEVAKINVAETVAAGKKALTVEHHHTLDQAAAIFAEGIEKARPSRRS